MGGLFGAEDILEVRRTRRIFGFLIKLSMEVELTSNIGDLDGASDVKKKKNHLRTLLQHVSCRTEYYG